MTVMGSFSDGSLTDVSGRSLDGIEERDKDDVEMKSSLRSVEKAFSQGFAQY